MSMLTRTLTASLIVALCCLSSCNGGGGDEGAENSTADAISAPAPVDESTAEGLLGAMKDAAGNAADSQEEATSVYILELTKDLTTQLEAKAKELESLNSKSSNSPNPEILNVLGRADAVVADIESRITGLEGISDVEAKARKLGIDIQLSDLSNMLDEVIKLLTQSMP